MYVVSPHLLSWRARWPLIFRFPRFCQFWFVCYFLFVFVILAYFACVPPKTVATVFTTVFWPRETPFQIFPPSNRLRKRLWNRLQPILQPFLLCPFYINIDFAIVRINFLIFHICPILLSFNLYFVVAFGMLIATSQAQAAHACLATVLREQRRLQGRDSSLRNVSL